MNSSTPDKSEELVDEHNYFESHAEINSAVNDEESSVGVFMRAGKKNSTYLILVEHSIMVMPKNSCKPPLASWRHRLQTFEES